MIKLNMTNNLVIFKSFLIFSLLIVLFGCDNGRNTNIICNKNPELCSDLHKDSWCRFERGDLIRHRLQIKKTQNPNDEDKYKLLINLENYNACMGLASGVQHIIHTERTNDRLKAYGISGQNLQQLQQSTKNSSSPLLAYYHWSRLNDLDALDQLLTLENNKQIKNPMILGHLAAYYLKFNPRRAQTIYLQALMNSSEHEIESSWLLGLADTYRLQQDFEMSYLTTRASILLSGKKVSEPQMMALVQGNRKLAAHLDQQALDLIQSLQNGNFASSSSKQLFQDTSHKL